MEKIENQELVLLRKITYIIVFAVVAALFMLCSTPILYTPSFYRMDFSEAIVLVGSYTLGPVAGMAIEALKLLFKLLIDGSNTMFLGGIANFAIGCSLVLPAAILFRRDKSQKSAYLGCCIGVGSMAIFSTLLNYFILLPGYASATGIGVEGIVAIGAELNPCIHNLVTFVLCSTLPFNISKGALSAGIALVFYKKIIKMFVV